ncbi:glycine-rich cell wall structural protein 1.8-like isoform X1 [Pieris napi]|uniref:glycine-rich cell wall structural protein 1.8-like isoform X1 n=1 Tax=Pieris napi TaxID=78633 RepID=UPI001FBB9BB4|nr:glycine-rich cell wall structural protein 1.8-like isoform X1 [Pieris napi]
MKTFICLVALAVTCHAGYDSLDNGGHNQDGGYQYTAPLVGNDFSSQGHDIAQGQSFGHDISGQDFSGGQGHDFSGGQGHDFSGGQGHDFSGGQGHDFSGGQVHGFSGGQGHDLSGGQGHGFSGGQGHDFSGGQGNDYTVALTGHGQNLGQNQFGLGHGHGPLLNNFGGDTYLQAAHDLGGHQDFSGSDGGQQGYGHSQGFLLEDGGHDFGHGGHDLSNVEAIPVGEHTDEEHPVEVPLYKHVTVPIHKPLHINVPKPILIGVPQPYPVKVPVHKPVAVPVETEISIPIEKPVPYPVVKHVPYPVEKHVPIRIEKTVTVHVPQPYPVKIPVYKTIHHHHKGHH